MDAYSFCWLALLKESDKYKIFFDEKVKAQSSIIPTFDLPINRLMYMYKRSSFIINMIKQCIFNTINHSASIAHIYNQICFKDTRICSLSNGPGVEIVGLLYAFKNFIKPLQSISVDLVTKHKEWSDLSQLLLCGRLSSNSVSMPCTITDVVPKQFKFFDYNMADLTSDIKQSIMGSDVVMMIRSFEYNPGLDGFACILKEVLNLMKKDALLFFIDSKAKTKLFTDMSKNGMFLYGPRKVKVADLPFSENHSEILGFTPDIQGAAHFALWKKTSPNCNTLSVNHKNINNNLVATSTFEKSNDSKTLVPTSISKKETINKLSDEQSFKPEVLINNKGKMSSNSKDKLSETTNHISSEVSLQIESSNKNNPLKISSLKSLDDNKQSNYHCNSSPVVKESNKADDQHVINNSHKSKNAQESRVSIMLERCEKLISVLETKIESISLNGYSESHSKKIDSKCSQKCTQKIYYNSHQPNLAHIRCCASNHRCCHHCCCVPKIQCKSVSWNSTLPDTNMPYLVIPMPKS